MTYNIYRANGMLLVSIPDGTVDNTATSLTLIGKNAPDFGLALDQNFVYLAQNWASSTSPLNPQQGQAWYDSAAKQLKVYDSTSWRSLFSTTGGITGTGTFRTGQYNGYVELSQGNIVSMSTYSTVTLPSSNISVQGVSHDLLAAFPNGFSQGINLANIGNTACFNGTATSANALATSSQISVVGSAAGNLMFSGQLVANITVNLSNSYVSNTNVTVAGTWSSVQVDDAGIVIQGNVVQYNDVVGALGYLPYSSDNLSSSNSNLSVVYRDSNSNFAANVMTGTAMYAETFVVEPDITIAGDISGSAVLTGLANTTIETTLVTNTGVQAGVYNSVTVNNQGLVTDGSMIDIPPVGTMVLYALSGYMPYGWVQCNGQTVTTDAGTFNTPNLSNVNVGGATYIMKVTNVVDLPAGSSIPGEISVTLVPGQVPEIVFSGGAEITYPPLVYSSGFNVQTQTTTVTTPYVVQPISFGTSILYDSIALALSNGDSNAVMLSQVDIFGDLSQLTVLQVMHNLQQRDLSGLPGRCGKYMLSYSDLVDYCGVLGIPVDITYLTIALQDQIAVIKVADISNRFSRAGVIASDANVFGAMYIGYERYIAIAKSQGSKTVWKTLQDSNLALLGDTYTDSLTNSAYLLVVSNIISAAEYVVTYNSVYTVYANTYNELSQGFKLTVPAPIVSAYQGSNVNVVVSNNTVDSNPTYFGGNINVVPTYGGGSFVNISQAANDAYYGKLNAARNSNVAVGPSTLSYQSGTGSGSSNSHGPSNTVTNGPTDEQPVTPQTPDASVGATTLPVGSGKVSQQSNQETITPVAPVASGQLTTPPAVSPGVTPETPGGGSTPTTPAAGATVPASNAFSQPAQPVEQPASQAAVPPAALPAQPVSPAEPASNPSGSIIGSLIAGFGVVVNAIGNSTIGSYISGLVNGEPPVGPAVVIQNDFGGMTPEQKAYAIATDKANQDAADEAAVKAAQEAAANGPTNGAFNSAQEATGAPGNNNGFGTISGSGSPSPLSTATDDSGGLSIGTPTIPSGGGVSLSETPSQADNNSGSSASNILGFNQPPGGVSYTPSAADDSSPDNSDSSPTTNTPTTGSNSGFSEGGA